MYDTKPDAEYVTNFAKRMERQWGPQATHDKQFQDLYLRIEPIDLKAVESGVKVKPLRMGLLGMAVDRDTASLIGAIFLKVAARGKKDGSIANKDAERHANQLLEPWHMGVMRASQIGEVLTPQVRDLVLLDRGWSNFFPLPDMWAGNDFKKMVEEYAALAQKNSQLVEAGDNEEELKKVRKEMERVEENISGYKASNFPLRWRYSNPMSTWPQLSEERWLPEVVEIRKMKQGQAVAEFGEDNLPVSMRDVESDTDIVIYDYCNWVWTATVIPDTDDPKVVREFEHDLGMNPYILMEANVLPNNDKGIRWKSRAYDFKDVLEALNESLSEMRHLSRRQPTSPLIANLDKARVLGDARAAGDVNKMEIRPDDSNIINLLIGETLTEGPESALSEATLKQIDLLYGFGLNIFLNPAMRGEMKSGTAAVAFSAAKNAAREILSPYERAIERGLLHEMKLAGRSVVRLNKEYPDFPDEVVVVDEGHGAIAAGPKDVEGQEAYYMPRLRPLNPLTEQQQMDLLMAAQKTGLYGDADLLTKYGGIENAGEWLARRDISRVDNALMDLVIQVSLQRGGVMMNEGESRGDMSERIAAMPQAAIMGMAAGGNQTAQGLVASPGRQAGNRIKSTTLQGESNLEGIPG